VLINVGYPALQASQVAAIVEISVESVEDGNTNYRGAEESHVASRRSGENSDQDIAHLPK
jgi:hypothetical protein